MYAKKFCVYYYFCILIFITNGQCRVANSLLQISLHLFFSRFRINLLAANHLIICERTRLDVAEKSLKFQFEIMTLGSSANNIGSAREFILGGRLFI
jgi:hypothetical protein